MSTSLLYHACGIRGYQYVNSRYECGEVIFRITKRKHDFACSVCGPHHVVCKGAVEPSFTGVPIGSKPVSIVMAVQRVLCLMCDSLRQIQLGFADPRRSYTRHFERYVLELSRFMTIKDVADHLRVSWDIVKGSSMVYRTYGHYIPNLTRRDGSAFEEQWAAVLT